MDSSDAKNLVVSFAQSGSFKRFLVVALCVVMAFGAGFGAGWMYHKPLTVVQTTLHEVLPKTEEVKHTKAEMKRREVETHEQAIQHAVEAAPDLDAAGRELDRLVAEWRECASSDQ